MKQQSILDSSKLLNVYFFRLSIVSSLLSLRNGVVFVGGYRLSYILSYCSVTMADQGREKRIFVPNIQTIIN